VRRALLICLLALAWTTACAEGEHEWTRGAQSPLSPRVASLAVWTGDALLVIGGDTEPCHPSASCEVPKVPPLADGAAYDPDTDTWRRIADAPVGFDFAHAALTGRRLYVWTYGYSERPGTPTAFLSYDLASDEWRRLPVPPGYDPEQLEGVLEAAGRVIVWTTDSDGDVLRVLAFDPASERWTALPWDPLRPGMSRVLTADGDSLLLLDHKVVPSSEYETPLRVAEYRFDTNRWRRLPDVVDYPSGAYTLEGRFVLPVPRRPSATPELAREWEHVQNPPPGQEDFGGGAYATALWTEDEGIWFRSSGWGWDATKDVWIDVPRLRAGGTVDGRLYASAGRRIVAFGGATWSGFNPELRNDTWTWSPADDEPTPALITVD
jgi:hypothetical protein